MIRRLWILSMVRPPRVNLPYLYKVQFTVKITREFILGDKRKAQSPSIALPATCLIRRLR